MQARRGYKAKRQDGKPLTMAQLAQIEEGIDAIEDVLGPLADVLHGYALGHWEIARDRERLGRKGKEYAALPPRLEWAQQVRSAADS
jgi:hypothetical protein